MRAAVDRNDDRTPWDAAPTAYTAEVLSGLGQRFGFDPLADGISKALIDIAAHYILVRRMQDEGEILRKMHIEYKQLVVATDRFLEELGAVSGEKLAYDMFRAARTAKEPKPQTHFPELTEHQKKRGEPYYYELMRLLRLLRQGANRQAENFKPRGGRPTNEGLKLLVSRAADVWVEVLGRRFTIDHHKGAGLTEAFEFVKALMKPLDDVVETQIVTAMRAEIRQRREWGIPT